VNGLLSVGDQIESGNYRFHSRFNRVVNFERQGRLVSVVDEQIGPGPLNIVLRGLTRYVRPETTPVNTPLQQGEKRHEARVNRYDGFDAESPTLEAVEHPRRCPSPSSRRGVNLAGLDRLPPLKITTSSVVFGAQRFPFTPRQRYHSTLDFDPDNLHRFHYNLSIFGESLTECAPSKSLAFLLDETRLKNFRSGFDRAFANRITQGVHQVFHGHLLEGIRILKGCGVGLTPSGDDFIAGLLIGLNLLQKLRGQAFQPTADAVFSAAEGDNIFSNTFLDLARQGLLFGRMKDLWIALLTGSETSVRKATGKLFAIGASSGADLATGFLLTIREHSRTVERWCQRQPMNQPG
jgi:hypothetical protein